MREARNQAAPDRAVAEVTDRVVADPAAVLEATDLVVARDLGVVEGMAEARVLAPAGERNRRVSNMQERLAQAEDRATALEAASILRLGRTPMVRRRSFRSLMKD